MISSDKKKPEGKTSVIYIKRTINKKCFSDIC